VGEARCPEGEEGSIKMIRDDLKMSSRLNLGSVMARVLTVRSPVWLLSPENM
jgi:hypothetical protein